MADKYLLIQKNDLLQGRLKSRRIYFCVTMYNFCDKEYKYSFILNKCTSCYGKNSVFKADLKLSSIYNALALAVDSQKLLTAGIGKYLI